MAKRATKRQKTNASSIARSDAQTLDQRMEGENNKSVFDFVNREPVVAEAEKEANEDIDKENTAPQGTQKVVMGDIQTDDLSDVEYMESKVVKKDEEAISQIKMIVREFIFPKVKFIATEFDLDRKGAIARKIMEKGKVENKNQREWWNNNKKYVRKTMDTMRAAAGWEVKQQWLGKKAV